MFLNKMILGGIAVKDAEKLDKFTRCRMVYENPRKPEEKMYIDVKTFGRLAEVVAQHVKTGSRFVVDGRLVIEEYEKEGQRKYYSYIIAEDLQFSGNKVKGEDVSKDTSNSDNKVKDDDEGQVIF